MCVPNMMWWGSSSLPQLPRYRSCLLPKYVLSGTCLGCVLTVFVLLGLSPIPDSDTWASYAIAILAPAPGSALANKWYCYLPHLLLCCLALYDVSEVERERERERARQGGRERVRDRDGEGN